MLVSLVPVSGAEWYDEFAIGWNEIFDPDPPSVISEALALPRVKDELSIARRDFGSKGILPERDQQLTSVVARSKSKTSSSLSSRGADNGFFALEDQPTQKKVPEIVPPGTASTVTGATPVPNVITQPSSARTCRNVAEKPKQAFLASEILISKKPPAYLRFGSSTAKESAIDVGIKERLLEHPFGQLRRPATCMEEELNQLRHEISEKHRAKRKEIRRHRRLVRRNRVKEHEDLEELEAIYKNSEHLKPLLDPVEKADSWISSTLASKTFFANLAAKQFAPLSAR